MGKIYCLIGKSASGKDTVSHELILRKPSLKKYVMYTTRPQRSGEIDGETYHFVTGKTLDEFEKRGKLIESRVYNTVEGPWHYATVDDGQMDPEQGDILTLGTLDSYLRLRDYFGTERVAPIYIEVEDGERLKRALIREHHQDFPAYREMCRRFLADSEDFSEDRLLGAGITKRFANDDLSKCVEEILGAIG